MCEYITFILNCSSKFLKTFIDISALVLPE